MFYTHTKEYTYFLNVFGIKRSCSYFIFQPPYLKIKSFVLRYKDVPKRNIKESI